MIVNQDTNPARDVYYFGAKIIEIIANKPSDTDFF